MHTIDASTRLLTVKIHAQNERPACVMKIRVSVKYYVARCIPCLLLTHPCVGRVEVAFDGTLPFEWVCWFARGIRVFDPVNTKVQGKDQGRYQVHENIWGW